MTSRRERVSSGAIALFAALFGAFGIALIAPAPGEAGKGANKTYGLTSKAKKNGTSQDLALKKPGKVVYKSSSDFYKARKIGRWRDWGRSAVTAKARNVKLCDLNGKKKTNCSSAKGTMTFEDPIRRRCKIKKSGRKKKVTLYTTTIFEHGPTGKYPNGRGASIQYGVLGKPACPKF